VSVRVNYLLTQHAAPISRGDGWTGRVANWIYGRFLLGTIRDNIDEL
jgi:hypothetical protein